MSQDQKKNISRRDFIKGAAVGAVGVATIGLVGCTSAPAAAPDVTPNTGSPTPAATPDISPAPSQPVLASLNPQDYNYTSNSITDFSKTTLFSPWKLGPLTLSHRMVKSTAGSDTQKSWQTTPIEFSSYYSNFAKGGIEMMWCEDVFDIYEHFPNPNKPPVNCDALKMMVDAVHEAGGHIGYQVSAMSLSGIDLSATSFEMANTFANVMTKEQVQQYIQDAATAAKNMQAIGFDGVELNAAGNNIGQTFLSRLRNQREDEYGPQSFENRARLLTEIIQGVKAVCGKDFIVQVLINGIEENDENLGDSALNTTVEENMEIAKLLETAGADSLHVRLGPMGKHICQFASDLYFTGYGIEGTSGYGNQFDFSRHWQGKLIANHSGCGMMLDVAKEIKSVVSIPVGTVTYMDPAHAPDFFESALKEGKVDFLLMTRPLTVDTEYVNKLKAGRIDEIAPCTRCMHCHFDYDEEGKIYEHCRVNACTQRAYRNPMPEGYDLLPANGDKNVMVIGGGPAGMEAARVAAQRGYKVTLYEKKGMLGGLLPFANVVKGPHENLEALRAYLVRQLELKGVTVVTGQDVDAGFITQQKPDVVILATGGLRDTLGLPETAGTNIISIDDIASADIGKKVTIVGGNLQALDIALYLLAQGKHVTMVSPDPTASLGKGQSSWVKTFELPMLYARGTRVWPNAKVVAVGNGEITIQGETGVDMKIKCDTVIEAMDMLPNTSILNGISGIEAYSVGDCNKPWNIAEAIAAGNLTSRNI